MHFQRFFIHGCSNMAGLVVLAFEVRPLAFTTGSLTQECFMSPQPQTQCWVGPGQQKVDECFGTPKAPPRGCSHLNVHTYARTRAHTHTHTHKVSSGQFGFQAP